MKVAFFDISEREQRFVEETFSNHELFFSSEPFSESNIPEFEPDVISIFLSSKINSDLLKKVPSVKLIATRSTGFDHIDLEAAKSHGVLVANVPSYGENTVAEFTFGLILTLSRKLYPSIKRIREEGNFNFSGLEGFDLSGKTLGVVGTGRIGMYVVKIAEGFGMNVIACDPYPNKALLKKYKFSYCSMDELLGNSDIVTLHVPYMPSTHHLLNSDKLKKMKHGAILINTARGGLIETEALVEALESGRIAGAGLDVLEEEGYIGDEVELLKGHGREEDLKILLADHALMSMENVILTPHNAFNTTEAIDRILHTTLENVEAFSKGKPLNTVKA